MSFFNKLQGNHQPLPNAYPLRSILLAGFGGTIAIATIGILTTSTAYFMVLGSFGASCLLIFGFPDIPFAQPRNVLVGYVFSTLIGLVMYHVVSPEWWSLAIAIGLVIIWMMATRTVHPPAAGSPIIVFLTKANFSFLLYPTLTGVLIILFIALIFNNLTRAGRYPMYW